MTKIMKWMEAHKITTALIVAALFVLPLVIVNLLFKWHSGCKFFVAEWDAGDVLGYIAGFEAFIGTAFLGALSLYQSDQIAKQSQKYNELLKEMDQRKNMPRLRVSLGARNGSLMNMSLIVENASENIAANICAETFCLIDQCGQELSKFPVPTLDKAFLLPGEKCTIRFANESFASAVNKVQGTLTYRDKYSTKHRLVITGTDINLHENCLIISQSEGAATNENT